jgi:hypothetical protein
MKRINFRISQFLLLLFLSYPLLIDSAPVYPTNEAGTIICMFYGGSEKIRNTLMINDTLTVYRQKKPNVSYEVGKIVLLSYIGDYYMQGRILSGRLEEKDLAKKGNLTCIVISLGGSCS